MAVISQPRTTPGVRTPLFLVGVALALVAFIAMFAFGILFANRSAGGQQVQVVMAAQDISAREPILPEMLTFGQVPASALPPKAILRMSGVAGFSALVDIYKGEVITANVVALNPDQLVPTGASAYLPIPQGYVAITLPTSEEQGVAGYIAQGDYINVIATVDSGLFSKINPRSVTRTILTSVYVIRVGPPSLAPKEGQAQGVASSLTVVLSQCDAQFLEWFITNATLKYTLLAYQDYGPPPRADTACPPTKVPGVIGPSEVDGRWLFTKG